MTRGIAVAVLHCLIVLSLAGKYAVDRERLPRVWTRTAPFDPDHPLRGRYVSLAVVVDTPAQSIGAVRLSIENDRLVATPDPASKIYVRQGAQGAAILVEPVAFFIPEHIPDPSIRVEGEELWVEVTVPRDGPPRPLRLGVKRDGVIRPLAIN